MQVNDGMTNQTSSQIDEVTGLTNDPTSADFSILSPMTGGNCTSVDGDDHGLV